MIEPKTPKEFFDKLVSDLHYYYIRDPHPTTFVDDSWILEYIKGPYFSIKWDSGRFLYGVFHKDGRIELQFTMPTTLYFDARMDTPFADIFEKIVHCEETNQNHCNEYLNLHEPKKEI